jgi:hypothetical protein
VAPLFERRQELLDLIRQGHASATASRPGVPTDPGIQGRPPTAAGGSRNGDSLRSTEIHKRNGGSYG